MSGPFLKSRIGTLSPPFKFCATKLLKGKTNAENFAKQVATEVYQEYMLLVEDILLGRLEENSDPSHPSFIPNIEEFFLTRVDKSPIEKFNILSSYLCRNIEKKLKDESKTYKISQQH